MTEQPETTVPAQPASTDPEPVSYTHLDVYKRQVLPIAQALVVEMGAEPVVVAEADRPLYHAALAHGSNHVMTVLGESMQLLGEIGVEHPDRVLGPLVRATVDNALASGCLLYTSRCV